MDANRPTPLAGGCLLALAVLGGVVVGSIYGQPSIGFLGGLGAGLALILLVWLFDLMRR